MEKILECFHQKIEFRLKKEWRGHLTSQNVSGNSAIQTEFGANESDLFLTDVGTLEESGITLHFNARETTHTLVTQQQTLAQW